MWIAGANEKWLKTVLVRKSEAYAPNDRKQSVFAIVLNAAIHNTCNPCLCPFTLSQSRNYVSLCDCSSIRLKQPHQCISMHHVRTHSVSTSNANTKSIFTVSYFQLSIADKNVGNQIKRMLMLSRVCESSQATQFQ